MIFSVSYYPYNIPFRDAINVEGFELKEKKVLFLL